MTDSPQRWRQLTFAAPNALLSSIEELMWLNNAQAITLADAGDTPILEPAPNELPLWPDTLIVGLFTAEFDPDLLLEQLTTLPGQTTLYQDEWLVDREWSREWMQYYQPLEFSRLRISPTEWPETFADSKPTLYLDPGLAFGAGTHPTTKLCLEWLSELDFNHKLVVDYGCGSGILALAAAKLGATEVIGIDHDPQAVTATHANAAKNSLDNHVHAYDTQTPVPQLSDGQQANVLVANILAKPLIELVDTFANLLAPGGQIALAGLLEDQADAVLESYREQFDIKTNVKEGDWQLLTGTRKQ